MEQTVYIQLFIAHNMHNNNKILKLAIKLDVNKHLIALYSKPKCILPFCRVYEME